MCLKPEEIPADSEPQSINIKEGDIIPLLKNL